MMCNNSGRSRLKRSKWVEQGQTPSTSRAYHQLIGVIAAGFILVMTLLPLGSRLEAQTCTADEQCQTQGAGAQCIGDILVIKRNMCLGGTCKEIEQRRENCGAAEASRCRGSAFEQTGRRCDAVQGRCEQRIERDLCLPSCDCRDNTLYMSTGQCMSTLGCTRVTMKCEHGCTCEPDPKCLDAPAK